LVRETGLDSKQFIGIGHIGIHRYWLLWLSVISVSANYQLNKNTWISAKIPGIGQHENIGISCRYVGANISVQVSEKYRLGEYIGIGIGWTHIGPALRAKYIH
jgi:hypothetical protein